MEQTEQKRILRNAQQGSAQDSASPVLPQTESFEESDSNPDNSAAMQDPAPTTDETDVGTMHGIAQQAGGDETMPHGPDNAADEVTPHRCDPAADETTPGGSDPVADETAPYGCDSAGDESTPGGSDPVADETTPYGCDTAGDETTSCGSDSGADPVRDDCVDSGMVGTVLDQRYKLVSLVAQGNIGTIFKATDLTNNETVAIKIFFDTIGSAEEKQQIHDASLDICAFRHPNVLSVLSVGFTLDDRLYFAMPYIEGLTLSQCIDDQEALSEDDVLDIFPQIADALIKIHEEQLVYRGLKPSNIILIPAPSNQLKVIVLDLGTARLLNGPSAGSLQLTTELFVSPLYMSPEQCTEKSIDAQADVYSLGCLMYEAITGTAPNTGDTFAEIVDKHINKRPKPIDDFRLKHHIPQSLERIVEKAMERDLKKRFQSMRDMKRELNRHKMGMTLRKIPPPPPPPPMDRRKPRRRARLVNKPILITMLTLLFFLIASVLLLREMWLAARSTPHLPEQPARIDNIFPGS